MNNGDSFHNGQENLELQNRNLRGTEFPSSDTHPMDSAEPTDTTVTNDPPESAPSEPTREAAGAPAGSPYYGAASPYSSYQVDDEDTAEKRRKENFNLASFILGIASFAGNLCCLFYLTPFAAILAIVFGCMGRVERRFQSRGLVGMTLGIVYLSLLLLCMVYIIVVILLMGESFTQMMDEIMSEVPYQ